jgi:wyosine [tRNA(Phe)-imidazoG37] synthetase (radical SAM superfamily)
MPATIPLQSSVVYGPVRSRRLGCSLGINVLPTDRKVCSSNCVYCQYGWTQPGTSGDALKRAPELLHEIEGEFARHADDGTAVDCITLAGNGEPTLHPDLEILVEGVRGLRDRYFPGAKVGILSDATQVHRPGVRRALARCDERYMKFDAGDEATWRRINLPLGITSFSVMTEGLRGLQDIVLQSMFIQGSHDNTGEPQIRAWIDAVKAIAPRSVQVYTVDRGTAAEGITEVPKDKLQEIADRLTHATGIPADVYD